MGGVEKESILKKVKGECSKINPKMLHIFTYVLLLYTGIYLLIESI